MPDFATKLRREPAAMRGADVGRLRKHGLSDEQILSATLMACLFNFMTRMADGLGVEAPEGRQARVEGWLTGGARERHLQKEQGTQHDVPQVSRILADSAARAGLTAVAAEPGAWLVEVLALFARLVHSLEVGVDLFVGVLVCLCASLFAPFGTAPLDAPLHHLMCDNHDAITSLAAVSAERGRQLVEVFARIQRLAHPLVVCLILLGGVFVRLVAPLVLP